MPPQCQSEIFVTMHMTGVVHIIIKTYPFNFICMCFAYTQIVIPKRSTYDENIVLCDLYNTTE